MESDSRSGGAGPSTPRARQKDGKSASEKLAEKLLLGWTMLGDICPQCATVPLMRDNQRQLFCVTCDIYIPKKEKVNDSNSSSYTDGHPQKHAADNAMAMDEAEVDGRVHYRLGGVVPLSAAVEESEQLVASAAAVAASFSHAQRKGRGAGAVAAGREKGKSGCTGGDSRRTESSDESDYDNSLAGWKVSPELAAWRKIVRRRCWTTPPPGAIPLSNPPQGQERGEEVRRAEERGGGGTIEASAIAARLVKSLGRMQRDRRQEDTRNDGEKTTNLFSGLRSSTLRKIQRYWAWLDASGQDYDVATVERDRQLFSTLHAALQVLDDLHRLQ